MRIRVAAGLGAALLAAGCGGGGDGGPTPVQLPAPVAISSGNQEAVAAATANVFVGLGTTGAAVPLSGGGRATAAAAPGGALLRKLAATSTAAAALADARVTVQAAIPLPVPPGICPNGGSVTMTLDDRNSNGRADLGEPVTATFDRCVDGGDTVNGQMVVNITSIGAGGQFGGDLSFANLRTTTSEGSATLNGAVALSATELSNGSGSFSLTVGAGGLTSAIASGSYTDTLTFGAGLALTAAFDAAALPPGGAVPGRTELRVTGTVASARANGSFTIATVSPVTQFDVDPFPRSGEVTATGANGSRLRLFVIDAASVRLDLDADGNGSFEQTTTVPWTRLL